MASTNEDDAQQTVTSGMFENHLGPPGNTTFFSQEDYLVYDDYKSDLPMLGMAAITWRISRYAYAVRGNPFKPDWEAGGGYIFVIFVHSGTFDFKEGAYIGPNTIAKWGMEIQSQSSQIYPVVHLPRSDGGEPTGDGTQYPIIYSETLPLRTNQGNDEIQFQASYKDGFSRKAGSKEVTEIDSSGASFGIEFNQIQLLEAGTKFSIYGFTAFRSPRLSNWPTSFKIDIHFYLHQNGKKEEYHDDKSFYVDLKFTAPPQED